MGSLFGLSYSERSYSLFAAISVVFSPYFTHTRNTEVKKLGKANNRGKRAPSVNPQGYASNNHTNPNPKSQLEKRSQKRNTKI